MWWHRAFVVSGLVVVFVLAGCPDKNSAKRRARVAVAQFEVFANEMCGCKDKACADKVQEDLTKWATQMAKDASSAKDDKPDEETMKKMSDLGTRYGECMTKAMTAVPPGTPAPPPREDVPLATTSRDADSLLRDARTWARAKQPEHFITDARVDYVDERGSLDDKYGAVEVTFGRPVTNANDSKRKIGAPVEKPTVIEDCFQITWTASQGWSRTPYACGDAAREVVNRCSVADTWKKAIARGAPPAGLAKIHMSFQSGSMWTFVMEDGPRGIDIRDAFADDCPLAVEK